MKYFYIAIGALAFAIGLGATHAAAFSGQPLAQSAASGLVRQVQWDSNYCRHLRYGCVYKHRLGEAGEGNCRRYREHCGGYGYEGRHYNGRSYCERLRDACIYKESRGEVGEGNCRRYRDECRGY